MPELAIIFSFIIVTTVISFAFGNAIHKRQMAYKERKDAIEREQAHGGSGGNFKQLEDRVRVLERIATDRGQLLSSEIDALRDSIAEGEHREPVRKLEGDPQ